MSDHRLPWPAFFYDTCDWFFWNPRSFNRLPDPEATAKGFAPVRERLSRAEEPLNQILRMFFALAPDRLIAELTARTIGEEWRDQYTVVGRDSERRYRLPANSTQPDFVFDAPRHFVTMEMKVSARTEPVQLAKYLYLHAMADACKPTPRKHALIYLGPASWRELWRDGQDKSFASRLHEAVASAPRTVGIKRAPLDPAMLELMADRIRLSFLSYRELVEIFRDFRQQITGNSIEAEIGKRLLDGVIQEIATRGLSDMDIEKVNA